MIDCPYCEEEVPVPEECNEPDVPNEAECPHCEKRFIFYTEWYPSYTAIKAPCLNGEEHDYQPISGFPVELFANKRRCSCCADEIVVDPLVESEVCDCGKPYPKNGKCDFCGTHARYPIE